MYITNIQHLIDASVKMPDEMPVEAKELIVFLPQVIDATTKTLASTLTATDVHCFRNRCDGMIKTALKLNSDEIHWFCPVCENEGLISGWRGTKWDNSGGTK